MVASPPAAVVLGNVPREVNAFVGRERELAQMRALLTETRMLTLVGPGGVGKTRLAVRLQAELSSAFSDGAWLVDMSPIVDPTLVPQALADVLGVRQSPEQSWLQELTRVLRARSVLLVLDNCEHLVAACAELVEGLLRGCPALHVLATSLQPLGVVAESTRRVPPLAFPAADAHSVQQLRDSEAVRLFEARVRAHLPNFTVNEQNARVVEEICRRLDGLPLALELVAARVESLGLAEVASRLNDRFALAVGVSRTAPRRQQTLQAALEWSWSLLDMSERVLLRRLGVFVGGWTLAAAESVCVAEPLSEASIVDTLGGLVAKSLVVAEHDELSVRYRLLETVRAYALRQMAAAGETGAVQGRHAAFMLQLAERAPPTSVDAAYAALLASEADNLRAALEWAVQREQADLGLRLATHAFVLWWFTGHYVEGSTWLDRLLVLPAADTAAAARSMALCFNGQMRLMLGEYILAQAHGQAAFEEQQTRGDSYGIALSLEVLGNVALQRGDLEQADALHTASARRKRELGSQDVASNLLQLGLIACEHRNTERARRLIAEINDIGQALRKPVVQAWALHVSALVATSQHDLTAAARLHELAIELQQQTGDQQGLVKSWTSLGHVRLDQGQPAAALTAFAEAVKRARASGERVRLIRALEGCARRIAVSDADAAVRLAGATDGQRQALGAVLWPSERRYLDGWLADASSVLGSSAYQRAWEDGRASTLAQAVSLAEAFMTVPPVDAPTRALTPREQEVAVLLARGLTNKQVAAALVVSPATVRSHVEHILSKLDLRSRAQIAVWASQQGLLVAHSSESDMHER